MIETITIVGLLILNGILIKALVNKKAPIEKKENPINKQSNESIVGKSTFVLDTNKRHPPKTNPSGKLDIEVPLDYDRDINLVEEQEELEKLGMPTESSSDLTFEEMIEVVREVETWKPHNATKTGKLLYENENTDWVDQLASSSEDYHKRIAGLIDFHLESLTKCAIVKNPNDGLKGFDIGEYV
jgi:hypothetical protein